MNASGMIVALQQHYKLSDETISYCNEQQFPVFMASWNTSYLDVMHRFSEILLEHERNETNLIAALKNIIHYPKDAHLYQEQFEKNGFFQNTQYTMLIIGHKTKEQASQTERLKWLEKALHHMLRKSIIYEENGKLIILTSGYSPSHLSADLKTFCDKDSHIRIGIGTAESLLPDLYHSYENALTAYRLTHTATLQNLLCYDDLGTYQLLANIKNPVLYPAFVESTLGRLIDYDRKNKTGYMDILECFFENDCNMTQMADVLFYHKNTLKYKMKAIREILDYDIMSNENRVRIMLAFYIRRMNGDFFESSDH